MTLFKVFWVVDALTTLVVLYFLIEGLSDSTVNGRNGMLWMGLTLVCALVLGGSIWLRSQNMPTLSMILVSAMAIPALLFVLFFAVVILSGAKWN